MSQGRYEPIIINPSVLVDEYISQSDWRVLENSNVTMSIGGLILAEAGAVSSAYWLDKVYNREISEAHRNADIHLHDLSIIAPYCAGWSIKQLLEEGLGGIKFKLNSGPAKHLNSACQHIVNFLGIMQNEWAGAQALSSFDTYLAPFIIKDNLTDKDVRQAMQTFVYGINTPSRWGSQAPFSNITLDLFPPKDLVKKHPVIGGEKQKFTYADCQSGMDMINMELFKLFEEGDANGNIFQYPIPTINIVKNFDWDTPVMKQILKVTAKYGIPYWSNFVNSDLNPDDVRSMCVTSDSTVQIRTNEPWVKITYDDGRIEYLPESKAKEFF